jgi:hypothetical protein
VDGDQMRGRQLVVTTTNKRALELVGETGAIEIIGKPYDLDHVVDAVKKAAGISPEPENAD